MPLRWKYPFIAGFLAAFVCVLLIYAPKETGRTTTVSPRFGRVGSVDEAANLSIVEARRREARQSPRQTPQTQGEPVQQRGPTEGRREPSAQAPFESPFAVLGNGDLSEDDPFPTDDAAAEASPSSGGLIIVDAKLVSKSQIPTPDEIAPLRRALVVYEYVVTRHKSGGERREGDRVRVAHWAIRDGVRQQIEDMTVGSIRTLRLRPVDDYPKLAETYVSNTLSYDPDAVIFFDAGQTLGVAPVGPDAAVGLRPRLNDSGILTTS